MATRKNEDAAKRGFQTPGGTGSSRAKSGDEGLKEEADVKASASVDDSTVADANSGDDIVAEAEAVIEDAAEGGLDAARKEAAEWQDRYMRLHAEWDTYRRRMSEQRAEEKLRATEGLIEGLIPVLDDFERSIDYANENGEAGLLEGVKAVQAKLADALKKDGLEVIDPINEPYNALEAQAVGTVPDPSVFDETVMDVYQKGYKLGKKVLRPAMVTVSTGGPTRPKDDE